MNLPILLALFSLPLAASIFDKDDRVDISQANAQMQELARSVPALIQKNRIKDLSNGDFQISGHSLSKYPVCQDEAFSEEQTIANCSASLITPNKVLTAAHCLEGTNYSCSTYSVVFDYNDPKRLTFKNDQVYHCKEILYYSFDTRLPSVDLAVIELDRRVVGRTPVTTNLNIAVGNELFMIGYPLGISQKLVETGNISSIDKGYVSFRHDLDSFSVNSGGPIFNKNYEQVGVLVRGTGANLVKEGNESCYRWHRATSKDEFSEGNDLTSIPKHLLNGK